MPDLPPGPPSRFATFCHRHYPWLAAAVLALAAFNLTWRLGHEVVTEWDESLYAISASEIVTSGHWIGVTFLGDLDYYNAKPPLNVWLIALAFKTFGTNLVALRLASALAAWATIALLMWWTKRGSTPVVSLLAGLVLSTSFGFLYVHAGRNANTDALFTLLVLLTVVTLWVAHDRPWWRAWLGPVLAAAFLLRGMAVLMPMAIIIVTELARGRSAKSRWSPLLVAAALCAVPVGAWTIARWSVDEWQFFERLFGYDFVARTLVPIEGHTGGPLYYLHVLQKDAYDWLVAGAVALCLFPVPWSRVRTFLAGWWRPGEPTEIGSWAMVTLMIPTLMQTKLAWYLTPFFPVFALGIAALVARGLSQMPGSGQRGRRLILVAAVIVAAGVAEGKLVWYSYHSRDLSLSVQGALLAERERLAGHAVYRTHWDNAEIFVVSRLVGAESRVSVDTADFLRQGRAGDFLVSEEDVRDPELTLVRTDLGYRLYCRISVAPPVSLRP